MVCVSTSRPKTAVPLSKRGRATGRAHRSRMARADDRDASPTVGDSTTGAVRSSLMALGTGFHWCRRTGSDADDGVSDAYVYTKVAGTTPKMGRPEAEAIR